MRVLINTFNNAGEFGWTEERENVTRIEPGSKRGEIVLHLSPSNAGIDAHTVHLTPGLHVIAGVFPD